MASNRFLMVADDSSAARMPRPGATMASATLLSSARFTSILLHGFGSKDPAHLFYPQHLDPRQWLAFQPFEKCAARRRHIAHSVSGPGRIERRHRIAAASHRDNLAGGSEFRRGFGDLDRAVVEGLHFEGAERPFPPQLLPPAEPRADMLDSPRADIQDHLVGSHIIHRNDARRG